MKNWFRNTVIITLILLCIPLAVKSQKFEYKKVTAVPNFIKSFDEKAKLSELKKSNNLVDITKYLPNNPNKEGKVDYTEYLQKGINENRAILMPNFPILINDNGLDIPNNTLVVFNLNSQIKLSPSDKTNYQVLRMHNKSNVTVYSPKIIGDRYEHLNTKGEWGMGISIVSSSNISIYNANITNCWGDGIYLGQRNGKTNENIKIEHALIDNNRRNGISVISVDGLEMSNVIISNTNGTSPESGLDFEPNHNSEFLKNINVNNLYTFNNKTNGVVVYLARLRGSVQKDVSITINNHTDRYSRISLGYSSVVIQNKNDKQIDVPLKGFINYINVDSYNSKHAFRVYDGSINDEINVKLKPKIKSKYNKISNSSSFNKIKVTTK